MGRPVNITDQASRVLASIQGLSTYKPFFPCRRGHRERFVANGKCVECQEASMEDYRARLSRQQMVQERIANGDTYRVV